MKRIVRIIPFIFLTLVTGFSQFILSTYLIAKGLIPREAAVVTIYGTTAFLIGVFGGIMTEKYDQKNRDSKGIK